MSGTPDPLRAALGDWWRDRGLPSADALTEVQALEVLDRITALEWETRPFEAEMHDADRSTT